ncbi:MAG TPA: hypothetical protein VGE52_03300 [Pirellulales bacterium]
MNADRFWERLHERLDERRPLADAPSSLDATTLRETSLVSEGNGAAAARRETDADENDLRSLLKAARALEDATAQLKRRTAGPSADLEDRVFASLLADDANEIGGDESLAAVGSSTGSERRSRHFNAAFALTAAALVATAAALGAFAFFTPATGVAVAPSGSASQSLPTGPAIATATGEISGGAIEPTVPLHVLLQQAQDRYAALAVETQSSVDAVALLLPDLAASGTGSTTERATEWLDGVKSELPSPAPLNDAWRRLWEATDLGEDRPS